jgi:hypothetical protein
MTEPTRLRWSDLATHLRPIFLRWEKLRPVYNAVLIALTLLLLEDPLLTLRDPWALTLCLAGAVGANVLYLAGPVAESYLHWLGLRGLGVTAAIFGLGCLVSVPLVASAVVIVAASVWNH